MNREVANMIAEEASPSIDRIAQIANGELVPAQTPREALTPGEALTPDAVQIPNTRVYALAPNQTAIEFMINHTLGMPGASVEVISTTEDASRKIQSAKDRENGVVIKDHSVLMLACEQQFKDFLPTAIDRLLELAAGVTVQYTHNGKTCTITHKPNPRSIEYITSRAEGRLTSVLSDLRENFENPNLDYAYTVEDFEKMTQAEREALYDCALRNADKFANKPSGFDTDEDDDNSKTTSNGPLTPKPYCQDSSRSISPPSPACGADEPRSHSHPSPKIGRGVGGEGCKLGGGVTVDLPTYITTANKRLADFLPTAITHLKTLAIGAQTVIDTETAQHAIDFGPDLKANMFFVNRFLGTPPTALKIENIKPPIDEAALAKLAAEHPRAVAKYGTIEAAIKAAAQRMVEKESGYD